MVVCYTNTRKKGQWVNTWNKDGVIAHKRRVGVITCDIRPRLITGKESTREKVLGVNTREKVLGVNHVTSYRTPTSEKTKRMRANKLFKNIANKLYTYNETCL